MNGETERRKRLLQKIAVKQAAENSLAAELEQRHDFIPELAYFLKLLNFSGEEAAKRSGRPLALLLCLQAPLELIHAAGFQPFKIFSGSLAAGQLVGSQLPTLMCPMLRSTLGALKLGANFENWPLIAPTTCDWVVKMPDMMELLAIKRTPKLHWLELPHLKDAASSQNRWLEEIYGLKKFLEKNSALKIKRQNLKQSIDLYQKAWQAFISLSFLKREGRLAAIWFLLAANTFFMDSVENWTHAAQKLAQALSGQILPDVKPGRVFLAGSPIFFPNLKIFNLLEEAGLNAVADDLCSSERLFPGAINAQDHSEAGLMTALAERYHQGCLCPTFADNQRRLGNILNQAQGSLFKGVVFHVLKGCHPYDLESFTLEAALKKRGLKFIKVESDYSQEDAKNILTRLEAFKNNLEN